MAQMEDYLDAMQGAFSPSHTFALMVDFIFLIAHTQVLGTIESGGSQYFAYALRNG
jgi:hypothetical protein